MRPIIAMTAVLLTASTLFAWTRDDASAKQWHEDLAYFRTELPRRHINAFHDLSRAEFDKMVSDLDARVGSLHDYEIEVELARIVAHLGRRDGHSRVNLANAALKFHTLPINFYRYADGLFIRATSPQYAGLLGARVIAIGGTPVDEAIARVDDITPGDNAMSRKSFGTETLSLSEVLRALGIAKGEPADAVSLQLEFADHARREDASITPLETVEGMEWQDIRRKSATPAMYMRWASLDPMNRHGAQKNFWYESLADRKLLYVNYSAVQDAKDESVAAFFERVFAFADRNPVDTFVLDIRNNSGGNNYLNRPIFYGLIKRADTIAKRGKFFLIIGRETFSAAQNLANLISEHTDAILVGEPTGGSPNHFGDPLGMVLPNSKLRVQLSSVWWQDLDPRDDRPWIPPQVAAELTSADDRIGRDPAMEAILNYKPEPPLTEIMRQALAKGRADAEQAFAGWRNEPRHKFLTGEGELNRLGAALFGEKRADDAVAIFEINAAANPGSWLAQNSLGRAYAAAGRKAEAAAAYERALRIRPNAPQTLSVMDALR
jgi:tetratricopeptide (TPR) repeat protein